MCPSSALRGDSAAPALRRRAAYTRERLLDPPPVSSCALWILAATRGRVVNELALRARHLRLTVVSSRRSQDASLPGRLPASLGSGSVRRRYRNLRRFRCPGRGAADTGPAAHDVAGWRHSL